MENNLKIFETKLREYLDDDNFIFQKELSDFVFLPSKRLRPKLVLAILKSFDKEIENGHYDLMIALELLHSATLVHDDIIDEDTLRRGEETLNSKFGNKIGVLLGDFLLSLTLKKLNEIGSSTIFSHFTNSISKIISGELNQLKNLGKIEEIESYIKRCEEKTAELFALSAISTLELLETPTNKKENIRNFARNFGIGFQIKNDLEDYIKEKQDEKNKNYTLPYILEKQNQGKYDIIDLCKKEILKYKTLAQNSIENVENREYLEVFLGYLD